MRDAMLDRIQRDLVGPDAAEEVLASRPSDVYLTGILWPRDSRMTGEEDERLGLQGTESAESSGAGEEEEVSLAGQARPCAAGVSFAAAGANLGVDVRVSFACYEPVDVDPEEDGYGGTARRPPTDWHRRGFELSVPEVRLSGSPTTIDLDGYGGPSGTRLHVRSTPTREGVLATVTLLNSTDVPRDGGRRAAEAATLFQVDIEIRPAGATTELVARPSRRAVVDDDDRSSDLLYRNALEFATGHTCSARWETGEAAGTAAMVATTWIPLTTVPSTNPDGHAVFDWLRGRSDREPLSAEWLAEAQPQDLATALEELPAAYGRWLDAQAAAVDSLPKGHRPQARKNIRACRCVRDRMSKGAADIAADPAMATAFALANRAMAIQHSWDPDKRSGGTLQWRPFQLGFVLLAAASLADPGHPDRDVMDLLWFPTGGGKTEAYLALIAFLAFHRRLTARHLRRRRRRRRRHAVHAPAPHHPAVQPRRGHDPGLRGHPPRHPPGGGRHHRRTRGIAFLDRSLGGCRRGAQHGDRSGGGPRRRAGPAHAETAAALSRLPRDARLDPQPPCPRDRGALPE